jgi:hypothetical protein
MILLNAKWREKSRSYAPCNQRSSSFINNAMAIAGSSEMSNSHGKESERASQGLMSGKGNNTN